MQKKQFTFDQQTIEEDPELMRFLEIILKVHQVLALVDVSFEQVFSSASFGMRKESITTHLQQIT